MAKGKFSKPRTRVQEDLEIEQALEQVSEQPLSPRSAPQEVYQKLESEPYQEAFDDYDEPESPAVSHNKKVAIIALCVLAIVVLIAAVLAGGYFLSDAVENGTILNNVTVAGVNIGGLTREEAKKVLHQATDTTYTGTDMVVYLPDSTLTLTPANTRASLDVDAAVEAAYEYGRTGSKAQQQQAYEQSLRGQYHIALLSYLTLDTDYIRSTLDAYGASFNSTYCAASYRLEGQMPELAEDKWSADAPCQTLMLNPGAEGKYLDIDVLYNRILDAYSFNTFEVDARDDAPVTEPEALDLDAIYAELTVAPVDAQMDMKTFDVIAGSYGYTFDLERAKELLAQAEPNTTVGIPMEYVAPENNAEELAKLLFRDVLATAKTKHTSNENRNNNLRVACASLNGQVLMPGQQLSYNEVLGKRTEKAGYKAAAAYANGETVQELGGGICQVSSTLYYATLLADLQIDVRQAHSYVSSYIDFGMDATVSWGGPEFKFTNNTDYPIRIEAEVKDGYVNIRIIGTDVSDYYVKMEYEILSVKDYEVEYKEFPKDNEKGYKDGDIITTPYTGYTVKTYKCKYSKETNELISRDFEAKSTYKSRNQVVAKIIEETEPSTEETTEPTTEPTTAPTTEPTTEATTEPTTESTAQPETESTTEAPTTVSTEAPTAEPTEPQTTAPTAPSSGSE